MNLFLLSGVIFLLSLGGYVYAFDQWMNQERRTPAVAYMIGLFAVTMCLSFAATLITFIGRLA